MDIDSNKVQALYQLSIDRTFSKASISLGITQPALSKKIARLEDELESSLVIRDSRGIQLTESGIELVRYYKQKNDLDIELLSRLSSNVKDGLIGEINIATYSSLGRSAILPALSSLATNLTGLKINFLIKEIRDLENCLLTGEANFIISNSTVNKSNIISEKVAEEEYVHIVPKVKNFSEFYLDHDKDDQTTFNFLKHQGRSTKIKRNYFDEIYGIIDAVKYGYGQAIVSKHLLKDNHSIIIKKHKKKIKIPVFLSYYERNYSPRSHRKIIETLKSETEKFLL